MTQPKKFRKKPVVIEAMQYTGKNVADLWEWAGAGNVYGPVPGDENAYILILEGRMAVAPGSWIIRGVQGEYYPCHPEIFAATHEEEK